MSKLKAKDPFLLKALRFGVCLVILVPLVIFRDFISPFHFGKVIVFRSLVEILAVVYLILILKDRSYLPKANKIFWALLLFVLAFTLATFTSVLTYPSFWGTLERMGGLWTFWHYFLFYIILTSVMTQREHWQRLLDLTIFVGILSAFYGFFQKTNIDFFLGSGDRARIFGTLGNAALFAGYQIFIVFLSLMMYVKSDSRVRGYRLFYMFAFITTSIAVLMTAVRGSLLGYGVGLIVFALLWARQYKSSFGSFVFKFLIGAAVIWGIFSLVFNDAAFVKKSGYLSRITNLSFTATTVQTRFWAWEAGFKGLVESPKTFVLGWGPENFNIPFSKYFNPKFFRGPGAETLFDRAHNMFIEILVTMGIIGLLTYVGIFVVLFKSLKRFLKENDLIIYGIGLTSMTVAYIIHNSFIFDTSANFIVFFTVLGFVSYLNTRLGAPDKISQDDKDRRPIIKNNSTIGVLGAIFVFFVAVLIYKTNILPAKANYATTRAIVASWAGDFDGSFNKYREALSFNVPGKYEYRHRLAQYLVGVGGPSVKEEKVKKAYEFTITEVEKNVKENPVDYLPHLYASRLNIMFGKDNPNSPYNDIALEYSMKALELSPTFVRTYYEIAQAYLNKKDYPNAIRYFQQAVDLNPDAGISHAYLGAAKIENGDLSGAEDLEKALNAENPYSPREVDFQRLINAYLKTNNFERIAWIYEQLIVISPNEPQYYASLATTYAQLGRFNEAAAVARETVKIDPSFESDARVFLQSLGREL
ncbi:MAG: O-antigen ligase family protein [Candidatus Yanofskybacteria bacterium]|nr:O-antigen ligase family protein [Candidatus Yanofskybacteria bacterium]